MELDGLQQLTDVGYPFLLLFLVALGIRKLWSDAWVWWKDVFWPSRELRWEQQANTSAERIEHT